MTERVGVDTADEDVKTGEVREPTRATLTRWVVEWVRVAAPAACSTIQRSDIESLTGLPWESKDLRFVLVAAKQELYRGLPAYEFKITDSGLYLLSHEERAHELTRRRREAVARHRESIASAATIDANQLPDTAKRVLENEQRIALHLYEESKKAARKKWLAAPTQQALPGPEASA